MHAHVPERKKPALGFGRVPSVKIKNYLVFFGSALAMPETISMVRLHFK